MTAEIVDCLRTLTMQRAPVCSRHLVLARGQSSSPCRRWALRGRCLARGAVRVCSCLFRRGVTLRSRDCTFALSESSYGRLSAKVRAARREAAEACALGSALSGCAVMAPGFGFAPHHTSARICSACAPEAQEVRQEAPRRRVHRRLAIRRQRGGVGRGAPLVAASMMPCGVSATSLQHQLAMLPQRFPFARNL